MPQSSTPLGLGLSYPACTPPDKLEICPSPRASSRKPLFDAMSARRQYKPALKNSVNSQLQTAFEDSNWPTVVRLAEKQAKAFKDPYYEVSNNQRCRCERCAFRKGLG